MNLMKSLNLPAIALLLFAPVLATAGGWGAGSFDNDDALDFIMVFEEEPSLGLVFGALQAAAGSNGYLEAPDGAYAIAAAEILAALNGKPSAELPETVMAWAEGRKRPGARQLAMALKALDAVGDAESSELAQLYSDNPELLKEWRASLSGLRSRLK